MSVTLGQLVAAVGGQLQMADGGLAAPACRSGLRVAIHSARVRAGEVFWALPGATHDGASFAAEAFRRGAAGVVTERDGVVPPAGRWVLRVDRSLEALWRLATWRRREFAGPVVAVTGSHGKTTTRELIATALAPRFRVASSPKNLNNHVGVPLSLLGLCDGAEAGVFELAASAPGEIGRLAPLAAPQVGVITGIGEAHLAGFGDIEAIARAKAELLASLPKAGLAVLNGDCPSLRKASAACPAPIVWFGRGAECDLRAAEVNWAAGRLSFFAAGVSFRVPVWGRHFLANILAAVAVARHYGVAAGEVADALAGFTPPPMRGRVYRAGALWIVDDTYNSNPSAMRALLELVGELPSRGRRIVVCGDMLELGAAAPEWHAAIGREAVTRCGADALLAVGRYAEKVVAAAREAGMPAGACTICQDADDAYRVLSRDLRAGDWIAIKGSRALGLERLVNRLRSAARVMSVPRPASRMVLPLRRKRPRIEKQQTAAA